MCGAPASRECNGVIGNGDGDDDDDDDDDDGDNWGSAMRLMIEEME